MGRTRRAALPSLGLDPHEAHRLRRVGLRKGAAGREQQNEEEKSERAHQSGGQLRARRKSPRDTKAVSSFMNCMGDLLKPDEIAPHRDAQIMTVS